MPRSAALIRKQGHLVAVPEISITFIPWKNCLFPLLALEIKNILFHSVIRRGRERGKSFTLSERCFWPSCDALQLCNQIKRSCCWFWLLLWRASPTALGLIFGADSLWGKCCTPPCWLRHLRQCLKAAALCKYFQGYLLLAFSPSEAARHCKPHCHVPYPHYPWSKADLAHSTFQPIHTLGLVNVAI